MGLDTHVTTPTTHTEKQHLCKTTTSKPVQIDLITTNTDTSAYVYCTYKVFEHFLMSF